MKREDKYRISDPNYWRTGRPTGTTKIKENGKPCPKVNRTHRMTERAHDWIRKNKHLIEEWSRQKKLPLV